MKIKLSVLRHLAFVFILCCTFDGHVQAGDYPNVVPSWDMKYISQKEDVGFPVRCTESYKECPTGELFLTHVFFSDWDMGKVARVYDSNRSVYRIRLDYLDIPKFNRLYIGRFGAEMVPVNDTVLPTGVECNVDVLRYTTRGWEAHCIYRKDHGNYFVTENEGIYFTLRDLYAFRWVNVKHLR